MIKIEDGIRKVVWVEKHFKLLKIFKYASEIRYFKGTIFEIFK